MWASKVHEILIHLSRVSDYLPAILIMLGVGVLILCAVCCVCEPREENDDIFHHEVV